MLSTSWSSGDWKSVEYFLEEVSEFKQLEKEEQQQALVSLVHLEIELRRKAGQSPSVAEYARRFPKIGKESITGLISLPVLPPN